MSDGTHIFLGPTLAIDLAKSIYPNACYHPPIECGDLIKLLRLNPKRIVIIDGLYESVPAVWHKEILLYLELGIDVWGGASMGALRAAELHPFGMKGFGLIYRAYRIGVLVDDDEVAVLHHQKSGDYQTINQAMIDIRITTKQLFLDGILSAKEKKLIDTYCKASFYPYRSLNDAIANIPLHNHVGVLQWINQYGLRSIKSEDATGMLNHLKTTSVHVRTPEVRFQTPKTAFLNSLTFESNLRPFNKAVSWLPEIEQRLITIYQQDLKYYMLIAEIAAFTIRLHALVDEQCLSIELDRVEKYLVNSDLYFPKEDFSHYRKHPVLSKVYSLLCQVICLEHISAETLEKNVVVMAHYYNISEHELEMVRPIIRKLFILFWVVSKKQSNNLLLTDEMTKFYLKNLVHYRRYDYDTFKSWLKPSHMNKKLFSDFLFNYIKVASPRISPFYEYFNWLHDALSLCEEHLAKPAACLS